MAKEFRKELYEYLDDIRSYIRGGGFIASKFDPERLEQDEDGEDYDIAITTLFERSGLDPKKPGHWKLLLSLVATSIYSERTGRKVVWHDEEDEKLFRAVLKLRKANAKNGKKISIKDICIELKNTPTFKKAASADALHARFNIIIRNKRKLAKAKNASPALRRDLKWFSSP